MKSTKSKKREWLRRTTAFILTFCLLLGGFLLGEPSAQAAEADDAVNQILQPYNIAMLIDKSGSMNATDKERLAIASAELFVQELSSKVAIQEASGSNQPNTKVSVTSFSLDTEIETLPYELTNDSAVDHIVNKIREIQYDRVNTGGTDLGRAVMSAVNTLKDSQEDGYKNMIILFTDGYTESLSPEGMANSSAMMQKALESAKEMQCEIFVVGLNHDNKIDAQGRAEIWQIANSTQIGDGIQLPDSNDGGAKASVNYLVTDSKDQVTSFYKDIFAMMMQTPVQEITPTPIPGGYEYKIDLTKPGIFCANVSIVSDQPIGAVKLFDPDGTACPLDGGSIRFREGNGYKLLTINGPKSGVWTLQTEGSVTYHVTCMAINGLILNMQAKPVGTECQVELTANYLEELQGEEFYTGLTGAKCCLNRVGSEEVLTADLTYDKGKNALTGSITVPGPGSYEVQASLIGGGIEHASEKQAVDFSIISKSAIKVNIVEHKNKVVDLKDYLDWEDLIVTVNEVQLEDASKLVDVTSHDSQIEFHGKDKGQASGAIIFTDNLGQGWSIPLELTVEFNPLIRNILIIAVLLLLIAALIWFRRSTKCLSGTFNVSLELKRDFDSFGDSDECPLCADLIADPIRGCSFTLYALVTRALGTPGENSDNSKLLTAVTAHKAELCKAMYRISIQYNTAGGKKDYLYRMGPRGEHTLDGTHPVYTSTDSGDSEVLEISVEYIPPETLDMPSDSDGHDPDDPFDF